MRGTSQKLSRNYVKLKCWRQILLKARRLVMKKLREELEGSRLKILSMLSQIESSMRT